MCSNLLNLIFVIGLFAVSSAFAGIEQEDEDLAKKIEHRVAEQAEDYQTAREITKNVQEKVMTSENYQQYISEAKGLTSSSFGRPAPVNLAPGETPIDKMLYQYHKEFKHKHHPWANLPTLLIFVSASIPENSLKEIVASTRAVGGVLVLRGMVEGSLTKTAAFIHNLHTQGVAAIIHPKLFADLQVQSVPTYVLFTKEDGVCKLGECLPQHDAVVGNVSLQYALELMNKQGEMKAEAGNYLTRLKRPS